MRHEQSFAGDTWRSFYVEEGSRNKSLGFAGFFKVDNLEELLVSTKLHLVLLLAHVYHQMWDEVVVFFTVDAG
jgi:hypothetical protein